MPSLVMVGALEAVILRFIKVVGPIADPSSMTEYAYFTARFHRAGFAGTWRDLALCAGYPDRDAWFPDHPDDKAKAIAICRVCPVRAECLDFAIATGQSDGIWGGMTTYQRRRILRMERGTRVG
jgi:WhiB family redox-sensing transcriptional regulator